MAKGRILNFSANGTYSNGSWADLTTTEEALALPCGYMGGLNSKGEGHAWFWIILDGKPVFYEGQTGEEMKEPPLVIYEAEG